MMQREARAPRRDGNESKDGSRFVRQRRWNEQESDGYDTVSPSRGAQGWLDVALMHNQSLATLKHVSDRRERPPDGHDHDGVGGGVGGRSVDDVGEGGDDANFHQQPDWAEVLEDIPHKFFSDLFVFTTTQQPTACSTPVAALEASTTTTTATTATATATRGAPSPATAETQQKQVKKGGEKQKGGKNQNNLKGLNRDEHAQHQQLQKQAGPPRRRPLTPPTQSLTDSPTYLHTPPSAFRLHSSTPFQRRPLTAQMCDRPCRALRVHHTPQSSAASSRVEQ